MVEYDCLDCGVHVFAVSSDKPPDPPLCASCAFLRTVPDIQERNSLAAMLNRDQPCITCPRCGLTSYHPRDIGERYCACCNWFHDHPEPLR